MCNLNNNSSDFRPIACLGFETAALFWRAVREGRLSFPRPLDLTTIPATCTSGFRSLAQADLSPLGVLLQREGLVAQYHVGRTPSARRHGNTNWEERIVPNGIALAPGAVAPLHVLVGSQGRRTAIRAVRPHLVSQELPPHALHAITDQIIVASPELTIAHLMRTTRSLPCLELICEWCGSYALGPFAQDCLFDRTPITDLGRIEAFLTHPHVPRGSAAARRDIPLTAERLASPRETELFLMLTLPVGLGGFALPRPYVNQQVPLKATRFERLSEHPFFEVDLFWPHVKLVVEYDGLDDHEKTPQQVAADKERRSVLAALGFTVIVVTKRDFASLPTFERKAEQVALALGCALPPADQKALRARTALFAWLSDATHDHAPFGFGYA